MIWGVDPDSRSLTICQLDEDGPTFERIEVKGRRAEDRFYGLIDQTYNFLHVRGAPQWAYIESPFVGRSAGGAMAQAMVLGAVRCVFYICGVSHSLVDNTVWKKGVIGNGNATKELIKEWAIAHGCPVDLQWQDCYDAFVIAKWGAHVGGK